MCGEHSSEEVAALGADLVAMALGDLVEDSVGAKDAEQIGDTTAPAALLFGRSRGWEQQGLEIAVAEAVDAELAAADRLEERHLVGRPRTETADALAGAGGGATDLAEDLADRCREVDRGKGVKVARVASLGDLGASVQVGDSLAQRAPLLVAPRIPLPGPEDLDAVGIVDRGLRAEDGSLLVVQLDGVLADPMLDADAFGTVREVTDDLSLEGSMHLAAEKPHHVAAAEGSDRVVDELRVDAVQSCRALEGDVGCPLALVDGPIVRRREAVESLIVQRVEHACNPVEHLGPVGTKLLVHQSLRLGEVADTNETVLAALVGHAGCVHLMGQPLPTIDVDLNVEWEPGLDSSVHEAE